MQTVLFLVYHIEVKSIYDIDKNNLRSNSDLISKLIFYCRYILILITLTAIFSCILNKLLNFSTHDVKPTNSIFLKTIEDFSRIRYPIVRIFVVICVHNLNFGPTTFLKQFVLSLFQFYKPLLFVLIH